MVGVEAGGRGPEARATTPPRCRPGAPGVLHGSLSYVLQDADGQTAPVHSVSAGLDYPGVGPGARLLEGHRPRALHHLHRRRGPRRLHDALRGPRASSRPWKVAHAVAEAMKLAPTMGKDKIVLVNLSGRGDKDCNEIAEILKTARTGETMIRPACRQAGTETELFA